MLANGWISNELSGAILPDERFRGNLLKIGESLWAGLGMSFSAACGKNIRQSAWRLLSHTEGIGLLDGHFVETAKRCKGEGMIIVPEDTTDINYDGRPATSGLGNLGGMYGTQGLCMHAAMAFTTGGVPLGIVSSKIWPPVAIGVKKLKVRHREIPIEEKESYRWVEASAEIGRNLVGYPGRVLKIADRESDFYEHFSLRPPGIELLVRVGHPNRLVMHGGAKGKRMLDAAGEFPLLGKASVHIEKGKDREERGAVMELRAGRVGLPPTYNKKGDIVYAWLVCAEETEPPQGVTPLNWYLLTTMGPDVADDAGLEVFAQNCLTYYTFRWAIERFHYTIKQGCKIEGLQMDDAGRLTNAIQLYCIIAWYILRLTYFARMAPDKDIEEVCPLEDKEIVEKMTGKKVKNVMNFILAIAGLAGFTSSKKQPMPGEKAMWMSVSIFLNIKRGYLLGRADLPPPGNVRQE